MLILLLSCSNPCRTTTDVDYALDASWICRPGHDETCTETSMAEVLEDGSVVDLEMDVPEDLDLDCFAIYPTMDLTLRRGLAGIEDRAR